MTARTSRAGTWIRAPRPGFTMLEILVVLVILALVAGVVAPSVGLVGNKGGLKTAVRRLAGAVHEARTQALRTGAWAELTISGGRPVGKKKAGPIVLDLAGRDADGLQVNLGKVELPEDVALNEVLVEGEDIAERTQGEPVVLRFHPRGLTRPAAVRLVGSNASATVCLGAVSGATMIDGLASLEQCTREHRK